MSFQIQNSTPRLVGALVSIGGLVVAIFIGRMVAQGNLLMPGLIVMGLLALVFVMSLGKAYWLLLPLGFCLGIPAIPLGARAFDFWEVSTMGVGTLFLARLCMKREHLFISRRENMGVILYCAWVAMIYLHNPAGLLTLGAGVGGLRFYINIAMAAGAFFIISSKTIDEKSSKIILIIILLGALATTAFQVATTFLGRQDPSMLGAGDDFYSWQQTLSRLPTVFGAFLFARYRIRDIFGFAKPLASFAWLLLFVIVLYSGKRAALGIFLIYPFLTVFLRASNRGPAMFYGLFAACALSLLILGNRQFYELPLGMQRALSILPGDWNPTVKAQGTSGTSDAFREKMRELAWERIQQNPIIGKGTGIDLADIRGLDISADYAQIALLAAGSSWHSTWFGIAADFGIPAAFIWAFYLFISLHTAHWVYIRSAEGSHQKILAGFLMLTILALLARSYTSGTSYGICAEQWWMFGILLGMKYTILNTQRQSASAPLDKKALEPGKPSLAVTL